MSGVFGVADAHRQSGVRALMGNMAAVMTHRPWYVVESHVDDDLGVGLGRIGIGVFNREPQPVVSEDGSLMVVMAGELFGTQPVRAALEAKGYSLRDTSDPELVLRLYQDRGPTCVGDLEGAFVIAIWDRVRQEVVVANDRYGLYPVLYGLAAGRLVFAPEMKGVLRDPALSKTLDLTALAQYARFQHLLGDRTFFEQVKLLPNAARLRFSLDTGCLSVEHYWDFSYLPQLPDDITFEEAADETARRLNAAIDRLTQGDYRFGIYLSGGLDSRAILGYVNGHVRHPVTTVTYGLRGCRDVIYAQQIADRAGTRHRYFEFVDGRWVDEQADFHLTLTEGFHSWIHAHGISILPQVRSLFDVNLTGLGGAELNWEDPALIDAPDEMAFTHRLFQALSQETTWPSIAEAEEATLYAAPLAARMRGLAFESLRAEVARLDHLPYSQRAAWISRFTADRRLFQYYTIFNRSHVDQRFPFCDYRYTEFVYALPPQMLFKRRLRRAIILKAMRHLASIPYDRDGLPITSGEVVSIAAKALQKGKAYLANHGVRMFPEYATLYADYENWLRRELRPWGEDILLGERTLQRGIFNPDFLRSIWRRHQSGREVNIIGKIAPLMTYEMMLRRFYD